MKLSIIIPMYNSELYIEKCVNSILHQNMEDYEVIVVDDGSSDNSMAILSKIQSLRLHIYSKPNGGQSSARNLGLNKAKGEYVFFIDSDDFLSENVLLDVCKYLDGCDILLLEKVFENDKLSVVMDATPDGEGTLLMKECPIAVWNYIYRRDFLVSNHLIFKEGIFHEDTLFSPIVTYLAKSFKGYPIAIYHHDSNIPTSTTHTKYTKRCFDLMEVVDDLVAFCELRVEKRDRLVWGGNNVSAAMNNLMFLAHSCNKEILLKVKCYFNTHKEYAKYLLYSPNIWTRILGRIAQMSNVNVFVLYNLLYRLRYGLKLKK